MQDQKPNKPSQGGRPEGSQNDTDRPEKTQPDTTDQVGEQGRE